MSDILLVGRNKVMASRVIKLIRTYPGSSLFFAFGHNHFTGDDSVTDLVRQAGFEVERVRVSDDLNNWQSPHSSGAEGRAPSLLVVAVVTLLSLKCLFVY